MFYVYLVRCFDKTIYCGVAKDLEKRIKEHNGLLKGGARYTRGRRPVELVYYESCKNLSEALIREAQLKKLSRKKKSILVNESDLGSSFR